MLLLFVVRILVVVFFVDGVVRCVCVLALVFDVDCGFVFVSCLLIGDCCRSLFIVRCSLLFVACCLLFCELFGVV